MSETNILIVDDRDPGVVHAGQWAPLGVYQEYQSTTSSSGTQGSTLTYKFSGTAIQVHGTLGFGSSSSMTFSIDGGSLTTYTAQTQTTPQFHITLFTASALTDGPHTLVITQANSLNPTSSTNLFIDYFLVGTGGSLADAASEVNGNTVLIDDVDPSIAYTGEWSTSLQSDQDVQGTLHAATASSSSLSFTFEGTAINLYGAYLNTTLASTTLATVAIDGGQPTTLTYPSPAPAFQEGKHSNMQLFKTAGLTAGTHKVVVTAQAGFTFDYATILAQDADASEGSSSSASSSSASSSSSSSATSSSSTTVGQSSTTTHSGPSTVTAVTTVGASSSSGVNPTPSVSGAQGLGPGMGGVNMVAGWIALYAVLARLFF